MREFLLDGLYTPIAISSSVKNLGFDAFYGGLSESSVPTGVTSFTYTWSNIDCESLFKIIGKMTNLENLHLSYLNDYSEDKLITNFKYLKNCSKLKELRWDHSNITGVEMDGKIEKLTDLSLGYCENFNKISSFEFIPNLVNLTICGCKLTSLPNISKCLNLNYVDARYSSFNSLNDIKSNTTITSLFLEGAKVSNLDGIQSLIKLKEITLNYSYISDISPLVSLAKNIRNAGEKSGVKNKNLEFSSLNLINCPLGSAPDGGSSNVENLKVLHSYGINRINVSGSGLDNYKSNLESVYGVGNTGLK